MSNKYMDLKEKYDRNYITKATLKKWVQVEEKRSGSGITAEEYALITGEEYSA